MKLTILQVGRAPVPLRGEFGEYPDQFQRMFDTTGAGFSYETVHVLDGDPFPDPAALEGIVITGSAAGVYEDHGWIPPLRDFVRAAYAAQTPMLGVCFGHQVMAEALGGEVRKSEKGWGIGRHLYRFTKKPAFMNGVGDEVAIAASHQDQVTALPPDAEIFLASDFAPHAGLFYKTGKALSLQPHPEFDRGFSRGLVQIRRGNPLGDEEVDKALESLDAPLDRLEVAKGLARFFTEAQTGQSAST